MVWWISGGVVVASLLLLVVASAALSGRLRELRAAARTLQRRAHDAVVLTEAAGAMRQRAARLQGPLALASRRAAALRERRDAPR